MPRARFGQITTIPMVCVCLCVCVRSVVASGHRCGTAVPGDQSDSLEMPLCVFARVHEHMWRPPARASTPVSTERADAVCRRALLWSRAPHAAQ